LARKVSTKLLGTNYLTVAPIKSELCIPIVNTAQGFILLLLKIFFAVMVEDFKKINDSYKPLMDL
jgi:hypothetical protein